MDLALDGEENINELRPIRDSMSFNALSRFVARSKGGTVAGEYKD